MKKAPIDLMQSYMRDVRRFSLLEAEEEEHLTRLVEEGRQATAALAEPSVPPHQQHDFAHCSREGRRARDRLVLAHLGFAVRIAKRYAWRSRVQGLDLLDLVQEGNLGLLRAAESFEPGRGKFSTFAASWIKKKIRRALADQGRGIRIPKHVHEQLGRMQLEERWYRAMKGRAPTREELTAELGIDTESLAQLRHAEREVLSLDQPIPGDESRTLYVDLVEAPEGAAFAQRTADRQWLAWLLAGLDERSRRILEARFNHGLKLDEIGRREDLTGERVRQIAREALEKLRRTARTQGPDSAP